MNWLQKRIGRFYSGKTFRNVFICWFLLFPFDAAVLPVSIGFMTVYPFLLLTFFLVLYSFSTSFSEIPPKREHFTWIFFFCWLGYGLSFYPFVNGNQEAFYEIRSLVLLATTVLLLFRARYLLGRDVFFPLVYRLASFLFIFLVLFGLFEFFTGIHFAGMFTDKISRLPAGMHTYAPVFLYDNPNSYLSYLYALALMAFLSNRKFITDLPGSLLIIFVLLFFSVVADSKFGIISAGLLCVCILFLFLLRRSAAASGYLKWGLFTGIALLLSFMVKPLFYGPIWKNGNDYRVWSINPVIIENGELVFFSPDSLVDQFGKKKVSEAFCEYQLRDKDWAINVRRNLFLNGLFLIKQSKGLGVGPGQYGWYHENKMVPYKTGTVTNPHESIIEIGSQYGVLILAPFLLLLFSKWWQILKQYKENRTFFVVWTICLVVYFIVAAMPSSWLPLANGWILLSVLLLAPGQLKPVQHA